MMNNIPLQFCGCRTECTICKQLPRDINYKCQVKRTERFLLLFLLLKGLLKQIDSGPAGILWGVNSKNNIYCRVGITTNYPKGTGWNKVTGKLKYTSCGPYGCWGVGFKNSIWFRYGVTPANCAGTSWKRIGGKLRQIEVSMLLLNNK